MHAFDVANVEKIPERPVDVGRHSHRPVTRLQKIFHRAGGPAHFGGGLQIQHRLDRGVPVKFPLPKDRPQSAENGQDDQGAQKLSSATCHTHDSDCVGIPVFKTDFALMIGRRHFAHPSGRMSSPHYACSGGAPPLSSAPCAQHLELRHQRVTMSPVFSRYGVRACLKTPQGLAKRANIKRIIAT